VRAEQFAIYCVYTFQVGARVLLCTACVSMYLFTLSNKMIEWEKGSRLRNESTAYIARLLVLMLFVRRCCCCLRRSRHTWTMRGARCNWKNCRLCSCCKLEITGPREIEKIRPVNYCRSIMLYEYESYATCAKCVLNGIV
jgi:hypothetical protein